MRSWLAAALVLGGWLLGAPRDAAALGISTYVTDKFKGEEAVDTYCPGCEAISVFAYELDEIGNVVAPDPWVPHTVDLMMSRKAGRTIYTSVVNEIRTASGERSPLSPGGVVHWVLSTPERRAENIRQLVELASHSDGIEIDYEGLLEPTRPYFTTFIQELRAALPADKKLAVILQPKFDNDVGDRGRAVDWRAIEPYCDRMTIMAYYYTWSNSMHGPTAPLEAIRLLANYARNSPEQSIPPEKLHVMLSNYGWNWPLPEGPPGVLVSFGEAAAIADLRGIVPYRHAEERTLFFDYRAANGNIREIWIDDFESLLLRMRILQQAGVEHVDFWHLNTGDPRLWEFVRAEAARSPALATGAGTSGGPQMVLWNTGASSVTNNFLAHAPEFRGGIRPAMHPSGLLVTTPGPGTEAQVRVWGVWPPGTQEWVSSFFPYSPAFRGGLYAAFAELGPIRTRSLVTGAGESGGAHVRAFDLRDPRRPFPIDAGGAIVFPGRKTGGARVAACNLDGDPGDEIVAASGPGESTVVRVLDLAPSGLFTDLGSFFPYGPAFTGGAWVACGDVDGDGREEIVTGAGLGGGAHVRLLERLPDGGFEDDGGFLAYEDFFGGVPVAVAVTERGRHPDLITAPGPGGFVGRTFRFAADGAPPAPVVPAISPFGNFTGGFFVSGIER